MAVSLPEPCQQKPHCKVHVVRAPSFRRHRVQPSQAERLWPLEFQPRKTAVPRTIKIRGTSNRLFQSANCQTALSLWHCPRHHPYGRQRFASAFPRNRSNQRDDFRRRRFDFYTGPTHRHQAFKHLSDHDRHRRPNRPLVSLQR